MHPDRIRATDWGAIGRVAVSSGLKASGWGSLRVVEVASSVASVVTRAPMHLGRTPARSTVTWRFGLPVATKLASRTLTHPWGELRVAVANSPVAASAPVVCSRLPLIALHARNTHQDGFGVPLAVTIPQSPGPVLPSDTAR